MFKKLLNTRQAASVLGVSKSTLERWREQGIGPDYERLGPKTIRYHMDALARFQAEMTVVAG